MSLSKRVAQRYLEAFKYEPKESKQSKVDRLMRVIRDETGLGRGVSEDIADALVRGRQVESLAIQKNWPLDSGMIMGPQGDLPLSDVRALI